MHSPTYVSDQTTTPNTTFVEANPSNFRSVVQKLTGASQDPSAQKLPLTLPSRLTAQQAHSRQPPSTTETIMGPKKPNFKLHERRSKKLQLNMGETSPTLMFLNNNNNNTNNTMMLLMNNNINNIRNCVVMNSPVSPLEFYLARRNNPKSLRENEDEDEDNEEKMMIAEKGFYLHPSPRDSHQQPPQLLPLFPLHSPSSQS